MKSVPIRHIALGVALLVASLGSHAAGFTELYVFGDSLSDSGNNAALIGANGAQVITGDSYIPSQPYALGAYTNASTWVSAFSAGLGLGSYGAASLAGFGNYAYGGATAATDGSLLGYFPPSATTQLLGAPVAPSLPGGFPGGYLYGKSSVPSSALFVIAIGGNDVRDTATAVVSGGGQGIIAGQAAAYATAVGNMVDALQAKGAQHIVVWDAPDLGLTPAALAAPATFATLSTGISRAFNLALSARMAGEAGVTIFDIFGVTNQIVADPGAYGLTNVTHACGAIAGCDPSTSMFWDGIHPTSAGHAIIASQMLAAVPEPSSTLMLAVGIVGLMAWRRRA
jgi:phospholipase/lecithinase/hemolysin